MSEKKKFLTLAPELPGFSPACKKYSLGFARKGFKAGNTTAY
jgi:hypothetical protein